MKKNTISKFEELKDILLEEGVSEKEIQELSCIKDKIVDVLTESDMPHYKGMVFIEVSNLTKTQKYNLIDTMHGAYFDTDVDKKDFAPEFVSVTGSIISDRIPVKLNHLLVEEIYDSLVDIIK